MSEGMLQNGRIAALLGDSRTTRNGSFAGGPASSGFAAPRRTAGKRHFLAGTADRLTQDWPSSMISSDEALYRDLERMRGRSRWLADNNSYYAKFISMCRNNIVGPRGVRLQAKILDRTGRAQDAAASAAVEAAWKDWSKPGNCVFRSRMSRQALEKVVVNTVARDGEVFLRKWFGRGKYGYQLELIDSMRVPVQMNRELRDGGEIVNGIEYRDGEVVAYWIGDRGMRYGYSGENYTRVDARFVLHLFVPVFAEQKRGYPWLTPGMRRLHNADRYEDAEVVQARLAAEKGGFFSRSPAAQEEFVGTTSVPQSGDEDEGVEFLDSEAGTFGVMPEGWDFSQFDPTHPTNAFEAFHSKLLKGVASAGNVNYTSLANDLSDVNYSSARIGMLEVRDHWQDLQGWLIESLHEDVYPDWLRMSLSSQVLRLPLDGYERFLRVSWMPRTWSWIDPMKEATAAMKRLEMRITSLTELAAERGTEFEDVLEQIAKEMAMAEAKGVDISGIFRKAGVVDTGGQKQPRAAGVIKELLEKNINGKDYVGVD